MVKNKLVVANWKMNHGHVKAADWMKIFKGKILPDNLEIGIAVPHVSLLAVSEHKGKMRHPWLGAQDVFWMEEGAFTGEISPGMLKELAVHFCLVGHSERRKYFRETDAIVAKKAASLQKAGIIPMICFGETLEQYESGKSLSVVKRQIRKAMSEMDFSNKIMPIFVYEPVWSIGTGKSCPVERVKEVHEEIRKVFKEKLGENEAKILLMYGGSVNESNVAEYLKLSVVDGVLIGKASLDPVGFVALCQAAVH